MLYGHLHEIQTQCKPEYLQMWSGRSDHILHINMICLIWITYLDMDHILIPGVNGVFICDSKSDTDQIFFGMWLQSEQLCELEFVWLLCHSMMTFVTGNKTLGAIIRKNGKTVGSWHKVCETCVASILSLLSQIYISLTITSWMHKCPVVQTLNQTWPSKQSCVWKHWAFTTWLYTPQDYFMNTDTTRFSFSTFLGLPQEIQSRNDDYAGCSLWQEIASQLPPDASVTS